VVSPPFFIPLTDRPKKSGIIVSFFNALFFRDKVRIIAKDDKRRRFPFNSDRDKELQRFFNTKNKIYIRIMWRSQ